MDAMLLVRLTVEDREECEECAGEGHYDVLDTRRLSSRSVEPEYLTKHCQTCDGDGVVWPRCEVCGGRPAVFRDDLWDERRPFLCRECASQVARDLTQSAPV